MAKEFLIPSTYCRINPRKNWVLRSRVPRDLAEYAVVSYVTSLYVLVNLLLTVISGEKQLILTKFQASKRFNILFSQPTLLFLSFLLIFIKFFSMYQHHL